MRGFFSRERFGRPQVLAGLLLVLLPAQCAWLIRSPHYLDALERSDTSWVVREGVEQWHGKRIAGTPFRERGLFSPMLPRLHHAAGFDPHHSPLWYLIASSPYVPWTDTRADDPVAQRPWLAALPPLALGLLLGASLWYVARRLYGNSGGYIALALYCFSPGIVINATLWSVESELGAAWGAFGAIFTAIAVAHTLYAPREVVLWNWRRILLLGTSLALAVGSQFSLVILVPIVFTFMLYLAPSRRGAAGFIGAAAFLVAFFLLFASYFFHAGVLWQGVQHASFWPLAAPAFAMSGAYSQTLSQLGQLSLAAMFALPVALVAYFAWPRARYFGNTAPLLMAALFIVLGIGTPHFPGVGFVLVAVPFLFVFIAGVLADMLETRYRSLVMACTAALLAASALWNLWQIALAGRG